MDLELHKILTQLVTPENVAKHLAKNGDGVLVNVGNSLYISDSDLQRLRSKLLVANDISQEPPTASD